MATLEIPLTPTPQEFRITLNGQDLLFRLIWCAPANCWVLDVSEADGTLLVAGVMLVTGADLLEQFSYLMFGFELRALTDFDADAPPTFTNLGKDGHLRAEVP